jgi:ABC-type methionine transport system ATPase subunit
MGAGASSHPEAIKEIKFRELINSRTSSLRACIAIGPQRQQFFLLEVYTVYTVTSTALEQMKEEATNRERQGQSVVRSGILDLGESMTQAFEEASVGQKLSWIFSSNNV